MGFFTGILIFCFGVFLFSLFLFARDDFVLLKKDVSLEKVFNIAFATAFFGLLFARIFFVLLNPNPFYLNPLVFVLFPYFPGLSFVGGLLGGIIFIISYGKKNKLPIERIGDFFTMALLSALPIGFIGYIILTDRFNIFLIAQGIFLFLFLLIVLFSYSRLDKLRIKEGTLSTTFLLIFAITSIFVKILSEKAPHFSSEILLYLFLLFFSLAFLFKNELLGRLGKNGRS